MIWAFLGVLGFTLAVGGTGYLAGYSQGLYDGRGTR